MGSEDTLRSACGCSSSIDKARWAAGDRIAAPHDGLVRHMVGILAVAARSMKVFTDIEAARAWLEEKGPRSTP